MLVDHEFKEAGDAQYSYHGKLDKACFQHDMAYGDYKDLTRRSFKGKCNLFFLVICWLLLVA